MPIQHCERSKRLWLVQATVLACVTICGAVLFPLQAADPTIQQLVQHGQFPGIREDGLLGIRSSNDDALTLRSAEPGTVYEFGGHYLSIAALSKAVLKAGDFDVRLRMGLRKLSERPGPLLVNLRIGSHWHELAFAEQQVTVRGIRLAAVRRESIDMTHDVDVIMDGTPFELRVVRSNAKTQLMLNGRLLQSLWTEPTSGPVAICVERESLLRVARSTNDTAAELRLYDWTVTGKFLPDDPDRQRWDELTGAKWQLMKRVGSAYDYVVDDPDKPNVLLIGDSISIYYTDTVRRLLAGHANVYRTPMGPGKAETLFASLDDFLQQGTWDVIHFNSGLHDFARTEGNAQDLQAYRNNLKTIIQKLRKTNAKLIWASTTPVPEKAAVTNDARCRLYNTTAAKLMREEGIPINDLHTATLPDHAKYWTAANNIHFNEAGSAFLGRKVAKAVLPLLDR